MANLIDFHIHIDYYRNYEEIYDFLNKNKIYSLAVTNFPEVYEKCLISFYESNYIKFALGYNPQIISEKAFNKRIFNKYLSTTKYIGEVGLDFSKRFLEHKRLQIDIFSYICDKCSKSNKILTVHSRNAEYDVLKILKANKIKFAIFHWYTGDLALIDEIIDNGYYFSLNPSMLKSEKGRKIISRVPINRILIESDGPFGKYANSYFQPNHLSKVYNSFEKELKVNDLKQVVFNNLKELLANQLL